MKLAASTNARARWEPIIDIPPLPHPPYDEWKAPARTLNAARILALDAE